MNRLFVLLFFFSSLAFSLEQNNVVCDPVLEGLPTEINQSNALACKSCQCLTESFTENPLQEQESYRHLLSGVLQNRFRDEVFPSLVRKIQSFQEAPGECSLDRLNQVSCSGEKAIYDLHQASIDQYLNWDDNVSCFSNATIEKVLSQSTAKENFLDLKRNIKSGGAPLYRGDPILKIYHENQKQFSPNLNYQQIKKQIEGGPLKSQLQSSLKDECNRTFSEVEKIYCQKPKQVHLGAGLNEDEQLMNNMLNFGGDHLSSVRYRAVACQERGCLEEKNQSDFCLNQLDSDGYEVKELIDNQPLYISTSSRIKDLRYAGVSYNDYCPLLTCADQEEALKVFFGEAQSCSKQASPKKSLQMVIKDLNCDRSDPLKIREDEVCDDPLFATLINVYSEEDEPRPQLAIPEGKTFDDLNSKEREEILIAAGYRPEELRFLGEFGVKKIFNQEVVFTGAKLAPEIAEARQAVQDQAQTVIANNEARAREEASREDQKAVVAQKERQTQRQAMAQQRAQRLSQAQETREQQQVLAQNQNNTFFNSADQDYQSALADLNRDIQKELARDSSSKERRAANAVGDESKKSLTDLQKKVTELEAQADEIRTQQERALYEQKIRDLTNEVSQLKNGRADLPNAQRISRNSRQDFREPNVQESAQRNFNDEDQFVPQTPDSAMVNNRAPSEITREASALDNATTTNLRTTASNGEAISYVERTSEELPFLSIEQLSEVQPGEDFVLGIRDGQQLATVEMSPEKVGDKVLYRADFPEDLSFEAKLNMMKSPFFQSYLHPESMAEVFDPAERARHSDLIKLLEFKD